MTQDKALKILAAEIADTAHQQWKHFQTSAVPFRTLRALERKGLVMFSQGYWVGLTDKGRAALAGGV